MERRNYLAEMYDSGVAYCPIAPVTYKTVTSDRNFTLLLASDGEFVVGQVYAELPNAIRRPVVKGVVYLAGPMRGWPKHNFPAFDEAAERLRGMGYFVFNPADLDREMGLGEDATDADVTDAVLRECLRRDTEAVTKSTHLALLPHWEDSRGVRAEAVLAYTLGLRFMDSNGTKLPPENVMAVIGQRLVDAYYQKRVAAGACVNGACRVC